MLPDDGHFALTVANAVPPRPADSRAWPWSWTTTARRRTPPRHRRFSPTGRCARAERSGDGLVSLSGDAQDLWDALARTRGLIIPPDDSGLAQQVTLAVLGSHRAELMAADKDSGHGAKQGVLRLRPESGSRSTAGSRT
ncbi:hypothetical protein R1T08_01915 [Streptomyces sp. SBC-4]|nr:hypothetical protein [Streptomyces sp. SBC-4]MDV5143106.1 hypothetical protein [Streptomyces sp. SBC-4]